MRPAPSSWKTLLKHRKITRLINGCRQRQVKRNKKNKIQNDMKKLKKRIGLVASRIAIIENYMLRGPKHTAIEVVAPEEEEGGEEEEGEEEEGRGGEG